MAIIKVPATALNIGLAKPRLSLAARLSKWLMRRLNAELAEAPPSAPNSLAENNPHVVVAKLWIGRR